ncbi:MAG: formate dehydrogenase subunit alpha [Thermoplasmata archaeon]|nr:formate dehydrogenase subunit alpha [Thermoplasmata archaeon]
MEEKIVDIICPYCGVGCNIELAVKNGKAVKTLVKGRNPEVNGKFICIKGLTVHELLNHPDRLKKPIIREGNKWKEVSWDEAISFSVSKLKDTLSKYGGNSIGVLCSGKILNEEAYILQKFARIVLKTNNIDTCARLCHSPSEVGLSKMLGYGAVSIWWPDFLKTETVMVVGANTRATHPGIWNILKKRSNRFNLIVADPCKTPISREAEVRLMPKPGTDVIWLGGLARIIYEKGLYDKEFIKRHTIGFDSFVKSLGKFSKKYVEDVSGIKWKDLEKAAELIGGKRTIFIWGMGLTQHSHGTQNVMALTSIALMTGNIGKEGCGVAPLRGQNNVQGAVDMGAQPDALTGHNPLNDPGVITHFEGIWNEKIPAEKGLSATEMIHAILDEKIKALYVVGENPALGEPQSSFVNWMLKRLDFLIVEDIFMTETAKLAHVVLPAAMIGEKRGVVTNAARRMQFTEKAVEPPGEAKPDWWIITKIANSMGMEWKYSNTEEIWNEIRKVAPIFSGVTHKRLRGSHGLFWPVFSEKHAGTPKLYTDGFTFRDRRARFYPIKPPEYVMTPTDEYPFILITRRLYPHFNTGEMTRRSKLLVAAGGKPFVAMNPEDASHLGLEDGEAIRISSPYGSVTCPLALKGDVEIPKGYLSVPIHFFNVCNLNRLTSTYPLDPQAKMPSLKVIIVRVEKINKLA